MDAGGAFSSTGWSASLYVDRVRSGSPRRKLRSAGAVCQQPRDARVCHQGDVGQMHDLPDAVDIRIGFGVDQAWVAIAGIAADAFRGERVGLIALEAERNGKGVDAELANSFLDRLHPRFVGEGGDKDTFLEWNGSVGSKEEPNPPGTEGAAPRSPWTWKSSSARV